MNWHTLWDRSGEKLCSLFIANNLLTQMPFHSQDKLVYHDAKKRKAVMGVGVQFIHWLQTFVNIFHPCRWGWGRGWRGWGQSWSTRRIWREWWGRWWRFRLVGGRRGRRGRRGGTFILDERRDSGRLCSFYSVKNILRANLYLEYFRHKVYEKVVCDYSFCVRTACQEMVPFVYSSHIAW